MRALRGEHGGVFARLAARPNGVHVLIERMERRVRQPGFVEVQIFDIALQFFLDRLYVVEHAVVGALRDRHHARLGRFVFHQRMCVNFFLDRFNRKLIACDRPDDAEMIARRLQENRNSARHHDRVQDALVAVSIHQHDVVARDVGMPHDLV